MRRERGHRQRGQALIETAIMLPIFLLAMYGIMYAANAGTLNERAQLSVRYAGVLSSESNPYLDYSLYTVYNNLDGNDYVPTQNCSTPPPQAMQGGTLATLPAGATTGAQPAFPAFWQASSIAPSCSGGVETFSAGSGLSRDYLLLLNSAKMIALPNVPQYIASSAGGGQETANGNFFRSPDLSTLIRCSSALGSVRVGVARSRPRHDGSGDAAAAAGWIAQFGHAAGRRFAMQHRRGSQSRAQHGRHALAPADEPADRRSDADALADAGSDAHADAQADPDAFTEAVAFADAHAGPDAEAHAFADAGPDGDADGEADRDAVTDADADRQPLAGLDADRGANGQADADRRSDAGSDAHRRRPGAHADAQTDRDAQRDADGHPDAGLPARAAGGRRRAAGGCGQGPRADHHADAVPVRRSSICNGARAAGRHLAGRRDECPGRGHARNRGFAESVCDADTRADADPQAVAVAFPNAEADRDPVAQTDGDADAEADAVSDAQTDAVADPNADPDAQTDPHAVADADPIADAVADAVPDTQPDAGTDTAGRRALTRASRGLTRRRG